MLLWTIANNRVNTLQIANLFTHFSSMTSRSNMVELKANLNNSDNDNVSSKIHIELISQEEGGYTVLVPDLPGCISEGDTKEEALKNIAEAIDLYLEVNNEQKTT